MFYRLCIGKKLCVWLPGLSQNDEDTGFSVIRSKDIDTFYLDDTHARKKYISLTGYSFHLIIWFNPIGLDGRFKVNVLIHFTHVKLR